MTISISSVYRKLPALTKHLTFLPPFYHLYLNNSKPHSQSCRCYICSIQYLLYGKCFSFPWIHSL